MSIQYKISIIMPIFNAEKYLERTINSIIHQSIGFEKIELILVNDNSTDATKDIMDYYSEKYDNIKSFHSTINHGYPGYGRNIGIENASSEYIMFIDNDDTYNPKYCEIMYSNIVNNDVDCVSANYNIIEKTGIKKQNIFDRVSSSKNDEHKLVKLTDFYYMVDTEVWTKIFKKDILIKNKIRFIENGLNEDSLFLYNYYFYSDKLLYIEYYGYNWYRDGENLSYFSSTSTLGFINSYYEIYDFLDKLYPEINWNKLFKGPIETTLIRIAYSYEDNYELVDFLKKLLEFEEYINFNSNLNHRWATIINDLLLKKRFNIVMLCLKSMKNLKIILDKIRSI